MMETYGANGNCHLTQIDLVCNNLLKSYRNDSRFTVPCFMFPKPVSFSRQDLASFWQVLIDDMKKLENGLPMYVPTLKKFIPVFIILASLTGNKLALFEALGYAPPESSLPCIGCNIPRAWYPAGRYGISNFTVSRSDSRPKSNVVNLIFTYHTKPQ